MVVRPEHRIMPTDRRIYIVFPCGHLVDAMQRIAFLLLADKRKFSLLGQELRELWVSSAKKMRTDLLLALKRKPSFRHLTKALISSAILTGSSSWI